ncbi:hypothetical protein O3M35_013113 [Rhynocoris fuscipes]|uniref:Large ribosomal subunit protein bL21m n=1 Tax=Rhynocoris fuscipes TaxID=488301 RepID=A0AAW1CJK8_9HEMI
MLARICRSSFQLFQSRSTIAAQIFSNRNNILSENLPKFCTAASKFPAQEVLPSDQDNLNITKETIAQVNELVAQGKEGRLFAVVHLCGKQFKVTAEDVIIVEGYWPPKNGDEIKLEKVLLVGGRDFTLVGRPILPQDVVSVKATVIEKDLSHTKTVFYKRRRKQYMRINFFRSQMTMLRINEVAISGKINEHSQIRQHSRTL